jgi:hypothetical protein
MNERIRQLAEQAQKVIWPADGNVTELTSLDIEKFAELIVEEFRNVLSDEYRKTPLECCGHFLRADEAIAKHFYGVEE